MDEEIAIKRLKEDIVTKLAHTLDSPTDFDYLGLQIKTVTGEDISSTTLKRLFGYIPSQGSPRKSSLGILARYLGFTGWSNYVENAKVCSGFISQKVITADKLKEGEIVVVSWAPDRSVTFVSLGESKFAVTRNENSQLLVGDVMEIMMFVHSQPLQVKNVTRNEENLGSYIAGMNGGLTELRIKH